MFGNAPGAVCDVCKGLTCAPPHPAAPGEPGGSGGCFTPPWIWGSSLALDPLEPQGSPNTCSASYSHHSPHLCQILTWEVPQGTPVTTKPLPVPSAGWPLSVPTLPIVLGAPELFPLPGALDRRWSLSPCPRAVGIPGLPISCSGKHRGAGMQEINQFKRIKTSPKAVRNPKCRRGPEEAE